METIVAADILSTESELRSFLHLHVQNIELSSAFQIKKWFSEIHKHARVFEFIKLKREAANIKLYRFENGGRHVIHVN